MSAPAAPAETEKHSIDHGSDYSDDLDLTLLHEAKAGRLVIDPEEAKIEFGELGLYPTSSCVCYRHANRRKGRISSQAFKGWHKGALAPTS